MTVPRATWNRPEYIALAAEGIRRATGEPWFVELRTLIRSAHRVLDVGCGDGTLLELVTTGTNIEAHGVDIATTAVSIAKRLHPRLRVVEGDAAHLPFLAASFDLVYSAYTLEHLPDPDAAVREMTRVLAPGGRLLLMVPNYGSPLVRSPRGEQSRSRKLLRRFRPRPAGLGWQRVVPDTRPDAPMAPDLDMVNEPDIQTLLPFLRKLGLTVERWTTGWEHVQGRIADPMAKRLVPIVTALRLHRLPPFTFWGNECFVIART